MFSSASLICSITVYAGLPLFICGTLGNLLNIRLLWSTRQNPCAFLFLTSSWVNCIVLFYGLFTRILSVGFQLDWSTSNQIWCKTRVAFTQTSFLVSLTCTCLASADRLFASCREEKYRKWSQLSIAKLTVILTILFWLAMSTPYLVYAELLVNPTTGSTSCSLIKNDAFSAYQNFFLFPICFGVLPSAILLITGIITYRNTSQLRIIRQRNFIQKQLTQMMLIQIPIILISTLPYVIFTEYAIFTATWFKSPERRAVEQLAITVVTIVCYITFACPFFVFIASSKPFRHELQILFGCRKRNLSQLNRTQPFSTTNFGVTKPVSTETNQNAMDSRTTLQKLISILINKS